MTSSNTAVHLTRFNHHILITEQVLCESCDSMSAPLMLQLSKGWKLALVLWTTGSGQTFKVYPHRPPF